MFQSEKKAVFPFIRFGLFDPEGLGAETRRPLVPQEVARFPLQSPYLKGEEMKKTFEYNKKSSHFGFSLPQSTIKIHPSGRMLLRK
ncbi:hypothetical protein ACQCVP_17290 [Rossellomorea vietnamensis]|uniref:hypothetical protein n=1 Tax=Rossellomorea vietnamensis TaxID=218284 RepID=UPI003CF7ECA6